MPEAMSQRPNIAIIATGGTIAGRGAAGSNMSSYDAAVASVVDIIASVPGLKDIATVTGRQIANLPSKNMTDDDILMIGRHIQEVLAHRDVDGVVVTHGTDTIEETAYFCNLTLKTEKPVVFVGAMRPMTALSADGPINLYDAVRVASCKYAGGKGVLLVMNGEIHSARDVTKNNTFRANAFSSPFGPLGLAVEGRELFYRVPARSHTAASEFNISDIARLPNVQIIYSHSSVTARMVQSFIDAGDIAGIVYAGTGNANIPDTLIPALGLARDNGLQVVRTSRTGSGSALRNTDTDDEKFGFVVADDQNPQRARLLLGLALTRTNDPKLIQSIFERY
jgi:glutamin-(asparagin-)ase